MTPLFAAKPTMQYTSQSSGAVTSLPLSYDLHNLAPVPQILCSPTLSIGSSSATCSGLPVCTGQQNSTASFSCSVSTTCNGTVSANSNDGGNCTVSLDSVTIDRSDSSISSSSPVNFTVRYGSYTTPLTSNASLTINWIDPTPPPSGYRTITFTNKCTDPIWFGSVSGAAPSHTIIQGIDCTTTAGQLACTTNKSCFTQTSGSHACYSELCTVDSDCVYGATCDTAKGLCFWNVLAPTTGDSELTNNATNTVQVPEYSQNNLSVTWSGNFGGRTGCTGSACVSALCTASGVSAQGPCSLGVGFQQPATEAEVTFLTYASPGTTLNDSYDVTTINGVNVPMSMYPTNVSLPTSGNPYQCGAPGYNNNVPISSPSGSTIGASSWNITTYQSNLAYVYVTNSTSQTCTTSSDCSISGQNCGLAYTSLSIGSTTAPGQGYLVCGTFAGWLTADQICGTNNNFTVAKNSSNATVFDFQCNDTPTGAIAPMYNLYQCNGLYGNSCYSDGAGTNCCGCVNWSAQGTTVVVPSFASGYVINCVAENSTWTGGINFTDVTPNVYNTILFLKQSCPSCYTYPFDDASSSFKCNNSTTTNTVNYTVEFCPSGNTGFKPTSKS